MGVVLLVLLAAAEPSGSTPNVAEAGPQARKRGAVPLGVSLSGGVGAAERFTTRSVVGLFTFEVGLAVDLSPTVALTAELGWKAGAITTGAQYRFNFSRDQRLVPRLGAGLAFTGVDFLGAGLFADVGLEWRFGTAFALYASAKYSVTLLSFIPSLGGVEPQHQLRQTVGVMLSL